MGHEEENTLVLVHFIVYYFNFLTRNQFMQYCIRISTLLSLASLFLLANLIAKSVDQQKSMLELKA